MSLYQNEAAAVSAEQRHSEAEEAMLEALYADLKPEANLMYVNYFLARTPAHLQEDMKDLVEAGLVDEPPVMVRDGVFAAAEPKEPPPPPLDQQGELDEFNRDETKPVAPVGEDPLAAPEDPKPAA
jgi:hypothetical protein